MASKALQKEKKIGKFWFVWNLVEAGLLFVGGVLAIIAGIISVTSNGTQATSSDGFEGAVAYVVASFVILDGLLRIILHFARHEQDDDHSPLIIGGFEIAAGVLLIMMQAHFTQEHIFTYTVVNFIAILLMTMGGLLLAFAIYVIAKKSQKLFMPIVEILFSAILIAVGIIIEILYGSASARDQLVLILIGVVLSLTAVAMFVITLITRSKHKKSVGKAEKEEQGIYELVEEDYRPAKQLESEDVILIEETKEESPKKLPKPKGKGKKKK